MSHAHVETRKRSAAAATAAAAAALGDEHALPPSSSAADDPDAIEGPVHPFDAVVDDRCSARLLHVNFAFCSGHFPPFFLLRCSGGDSLSIPELPLNQVGSCAAAAALLHLVHSSALA